MDKKLLNHFTLTDVSATDVCRAFQSPQMEPPAQLLQARFQDEVRHKPEEGQLLLQALQREGREVGE